MPDNEGLALTLELVGRIISPKAGIINGLDIPNSNSTNIHYRYKKLALVMLEYFQTTDTIIITDTSSSTMTGGSR